MTVEVVQRAAGGQLARTVLRPPEWHTLAACQEHDQTDWYSQDRHRRDRARAVCTGCPVRFDCALDALQRGEGFGVWGGLDVGERRTLARTFGYPIPNAPRHGTRSRYVAGCRCPDCTRAHAHYEHQRRIGLRHLTSTMDGPVHNPCT